MTNRDPKICDALLIRKTPVGESDALATLFTRDFGKITAVAKGASSSRKRFGGGLERFAVLRIEFAPSRSGAKILRSSETVKVFENLTENIGVFLKASCVLEIIDACLSEEEAPCETVFTETLKAFSAMSKGFARSAMLGFQTASLDYFGYGIDTSRCGRCGRRNFGRGSLIFPAGRVLCGGCGRGSREKPARKINCPDSAENGALENINCLNAFFQYQTGRVLKSAKILESMSG